VIPKNNLITPASSSFEDGTIGAWRASGSWNQGGAVNCTLANIDVPAGRVHIDGSRCLQLTAIAAGDMWATIPGIPVNDVSSYAWSAYFLSAGTNRTCAIGAQCRDSAGVSRGQPSVSVQDNANEWHGVGLQRFLVAGSVTVDLMLSVTGCGVGERHMFDLIVLTGPPVAYADPCVRRAWLVLGDLTMPLEDSAAGYFCSELNLGSPEIREVKSNRPDQNGVDDLTSLMGGRVVSANIAAIKGAGARIDEVAASFGPFMVPSVRPVLHYVLDRADNPERVLTLRAESSGWPIAGADKRDVQLQWLAADPVAYDPTVNVVTAWAPATTVAGRTYDVTYDRTYAGGGGAQPGPAYADIWNDGDLPVSPVLDIYGPVTTPKVYMIYLPANGGVYGPTVHFVDGFRIDAGERVTVDTARHVAYRNGDPTQSVITGISWPGTVWPVLPPGRTRMTMTAAAGSSYLTQVAATWRNGYLS
jgi:hypothetical protein